MSKGFAHTENQNITIFIRINPFLFLIFCQRPQFLYFCNVIFKLLKNIQSHPVWVRGLKRFNLLVKSFVELSHPVWVRGLKPQFANLGEQEILSHPVWVRGLKH